MAQPTSETGNLVLKWKQEEQIDAFLASNLMCCPVSYLSMLQQGQGKRCIIYVPTDGIPNRPDLNAHFAAKAVLHRVEIDPFDNRHVIVHLANLTPLSFPTPRELNGMLLEYGELYGRRDRSREQHVVRKIEAMNFQRILYYGEAGTLIGFGSATHFAPKVEEFEETTLGGFSDADQDANDDPVYRQRRAKARSYLVQRKTLSIDQRRCIVSDFCATFRGRHIGVEVIHLWPLKQAGPDVISNTAVMHTTLHHLYDRFVFTLTDDFDILWASDADKDLLVHGLSVGTRAHFLRKPADMPDMTNIRRHRQQFMEREQRFNA
ncbi:hypothetical protein JYU29_18185 [Tianweitania sp. BSSL-BM11]|uniref:HNH endonuclease n=1 Tax=Tianweitania aestuarii TaxID=2814886 RepID=A0ABS5RZY3_9HYPH|nr:hypothetical protein [Tianweitania aestuarii]MBS9722628.1 hypothetical protein [Tianweitania aestuarii]